MVTTPQVRRFANVLRLSIQPIQHRPLVSSWPRTWSPATDYSTKLHPRYQQVKQAALFQGIRDSHSSSRKSEPTAVAGSARSSPQNRAAPSPSPSPSPRKSKSQPRPNCATSGAPGEPEEGPAGGQVGSWLCAITITPRSYESLAHRKYSTVRRRDAIRSRRRVSNLSVVETGTLAWDGGDCPKTTHLPLASLGIITIFEELLSQFSRVACSPFPWVFSLATAPFYYPPFRLQRLLPWFIAVFTVAVICTTRLYTVAPPRVSLTTGIPVLSRVDYQASHNHAAYRIELCCPFGISNPSHSFQPPPCSGNDLQISMPEPPVCVSERILLTGSLNSETHVCSSVAEIGSEEVHEGGDRPTLYYPRGCRAPRPRRVVFRQIRELFARPRCKFDRTNQICEPTMSLPP